MNNSRDFKFSTKEYSTAQNFKHVSPMLSKQPILYCCVVHFIFYPLWEDLIELISFSQTPHTPAPGGWCSHQIFCLPILCRLSCYCLWRRGLHPVVTARQSPAAGPSKPQDSGQMCGGCHTEEVGTGDTRPGLPCPLVPLVAPSWSVWEHNSSRSSQVHQRHAENSKQTSPPLNEPTWGFAVIIVMNTSFNSGCIIRVCMSSNPLEHEVLNSHT